MKAAVIGVVLLLGLPFRTQAHFISYFWPQKSLEHREVGSPTAPHALLIGGTGSDFKNAAVQAVVDSLRSDSLHIKVVGVKALRSEDPSAYDAVLVVNTCMGWNMNSRLKKYISSHPDYERFVVLTTSGDPDSCCASHKLPENMDAVSSASVSRKLPAVVDEALGLLRQYLPAPEEGGLEENTVEEKSEE